MEKAPHTRSLLKSIFYAACLKSKYNDKCNSATESMEFSFSSNQLPHDAEHLQKTTLQRRNMRQSTLTDGGHATFSSSVSKHQNLPTEDEIDCVGRQTSNAHYFSITAPEDLPKVRPVPTTMPFASEWYDEGQGQKRLAELRSFDKMPSLETIRDMNEYSAYLSILFMVLQPYTLQLLRFLSRRKQSTHSMEREWQAWESSQHQHYEHSRLLPSEAEFVRPAGTLNATLSVMTFQAAKLEQSTNVGPADYFSSAFTEHIRRKIGRQMYRVLAMDMIRLRTPEVTTLQEKQSDRRAWPEGSLEHHAEFSFTVISKSTIKAWALCGTEVVKQYTEYMAPVSHLTDISQPRVLLKEFTMPTSNLPMKVFVEFDPAGEIQRLLFSGSDPESLHYLHKAGPIRFNRGSNFDNAINFAAVVANVDVEWRYGEIEFLKRSLRRGKALPMNTDLGLFPPDSTILEYATTLLSIQATDRPEGQHEALLGSFVDDPRPNRYVSADPVRTSSGITAAATLHSSKSSNAEANLHVRWPSQESDINEQVAAGAPQSVRPRGKVPSKEDSPNSVALKPINRTTKYADLFHYAESDNDLELTEVRVKCEKCGDRRLDKEPKYDEDSKYVANQTSCDKCPRTDGPTRKNRKAERVFIPVDETMQYVRYSSIAVRHRKAKDKADRAQGLYRAIKTRPKRTKSKGKTEEFIEDNNVQADGEDDL